MKYRLIEAPNMKLAMMKIHQEMGPDTLIYRTRNCVGGIEVLAGLPADDETPEDNNGAYEEFKSTQSKHDDDKPDLEEKIQELNKKILMLSGSLERISNNEFRKFNMRQYIMKTWKSFRKKFIKKRYFSKLYQKARSKVKNVDMILSMLGVKETHSLMLPKHEEIKEHCVRALIGPTGVGKTTTIIKIAAQFSMRYDLSELGIISTNIDDLYVKNKLNHFCDLYNVGYIHVNTLDELNRALDKFKDKRMVLIDTHGISPRDTIAINRQKKLLMKSRHDISIYLTVSASQQVEVIDDCAKRFATNELSGCILTKVDEALRIEPALAVVTQNNLPVTYVCNGEDLESDIYVLREDHKNENDEIKLFSSVPMKDFNHQPSNWV